MTEIQAYIHSGIIEAYVTGIATTAEMAGVEAYAATHAEVKDAIEKFSYDLEKFVLQHPEEPDPLVRPMVMASYDYMQRLTSGEQPAFPHLLTVNASVKDYEKWLLRSDMLQPNGDEVFAKIIGYTSQVTTAIVWLKYGASPEVHHHEYERFLIVEGTCDIIVEEKVYSFGPGDFFEIPLHSVHSLQVTSSFPCKAILQRVAA